MACGHTTSLSRAVGLAALACATLASPVLAQDLPPADELIDAYVEAIGGREANTAPSSIRTTGSIEMPAMGLQGRFELLQVTPDQSVMRISLPGLGEVQTGFDGEAGWSVNPMQGAALMQGAELAQTRARANVLATLRDPAVVPTRETVELTEYDGEACWRVRLVWISGDESYDCYSRDTGLLVSSEDSQVSPMGTMQVTTGYSDYRDFFGMVLPTRLVQTAMGQVQEMNVKEVRVDDVDAAEMAPPVAIQTLLDEAAGH
jgi:hypothetical protein